MHGRLHTCLSEMRERDEMRERGVMSMLAVRLALLQMSRWGFLPFVKMALFFSF